MLTERAIELVQEKLLEYALSPNDGIVSTIMDGASIIIKFGRETETLHFFVLHKPYILMFAIGYIRKSPSK